MRSFYGDCKKHSYFEGWYLKQQNGQDTVALIPSFHRDAYGRASASLQVITDEGSHSFAFPASQFYADPDRLNLHLGRCLFTEQGCRLDLTQKNFSLTGFLQFGSFTAPKEDIMGPFRYVPLMQCRHSVFSLAHRVNGRLFLDGREIRFIEGAGYMEGDRGCSFPSRYIWTHCAFGHNSSVMLSAADVPILKGSFTGVIASVLNQGREYRIATYHGARLEIVRPDFVLVRQGKLTLQVERRKTAAGYPLKAPSFGKMARTIHENASCRVRYRFAVDGSPEESFDRVSDQASFESCWENKSEAADRRLVRSI